LPAESRREHRAVLIVESIRVFQQRERVRSAEEFPENFWGVASVFVAALEVAVFVFDARAESVETVDVEYTSFVR